ncbi:Bet_v_1 domain-containing protein [Cephalotus follicularis]|uniref:Bet_v_1 domain-containing protein n=1 Tax=Cephalotus follicularis TaxID=3775 RepID=A0A1Q3BQS4_CEPFO|nr:Bet_v_1 domain-containing protein [Cephalotus follicularis]
MRSLKGEVVLNIPAERAWEMLMDNDIFGKINPEVIAGAEYIQGDGCPGSLRVVKLGPALSGYGKEATKRIEKVEIGRSVTFTVIGGELRDKFDPYRVTFTFIPMATEVNENQKCIAEYKSEFEPLTPATPPPETARNAALVLLKSFEDFEPAATRS